MKKKILAVLLAAAMLSGLLLTAGFTEGETADPATVSAEADRGEPAAEQEAETEETVPDTSPAVLEDAPADDAADEASALPAQEAEISAPREEAARTPALDGDAGTCTVSFSPGTGTGSMDSVTVNAGEEYELPACGFTHTNSERAFYAWSVHGVPMDPGDTITVNEDIAIKAVWQYTESQTIDNSVDRSTTEVVGKLILRDADTGEERTEVVFDEVTASAFTEPSNPTVNAMITEAQEALSQAKQEYAGQGTVTTVGEEVSGPEITKTINDRTYTYFDSGLDGQGDVISHLLIIDGEYLHNWLYTVTLEAEYESGEEPAISYLHILPGGGGCFSVSFEGKTSDDQPWDMPEGTLVTVTAIPDEGYSFKGWYKGDVNGSSYEEMLTDELLSSDEVYIFTAAGYPYLCPVFEEVTATAHPGDQVQMWVGSTEVVGPDSSAQGGKVAVRYTPGYDDYPEIRAKDGTDFVAGEILQFYKGDECTVYAKPDEGHRFVGWYHVNIEWGPGETLAWQGSAISTESSFTYRPGETVIPGDGEALRYVCAVFEPYSGEDEPAEPDPDPVVTVSPTYAPGGGTAGKPAPAQPVRSSPKTGDDSHAVLWGLMLAAAGAGLGAVLSRRRRREF